MSLAKAIKRSYRFFIPPSLLHPRELVRRSYQVSLFYFIGLITGMYIYAGPGDVNRITSISLAGCVVLLILKSWAGVPLE